MWNWEAREATGEVWIGNRTEPRRNAIGITKQFGIGNDRKWSTRMVRLQPHRCIVFRFRLSPCTLLVVAVRRRLVIHHKVSESYISRTVYLESPSFAWLMPPAVTVENTVSDSFGSNFSRIVQQRITKFHILMAMDCLIFYARFDINSCFWSAAKCTWILHESA